MFSLSSQHHATLFFEKRKNKDMKNKVKSFLLLICLCISGLTACTTQTEQTVDSTFEFNEEQAYIEDRKSVV